MSAEVKTYMFTEEDGTTHASYGAEIFIPRACRIMALIQDIDYTMPVWLNIVALAIAVIRF
jgi:hypothetical protein